MYLFSQAKCVYEKSVYEKSVYETTKNIVTQAKRNEHFNPISPTKQKGSNCIFGQTLVIIIFMTFKASFVMWQNILSDCDLCDFNILSFGEKWCVK